MHANFVLPSGTGSLTLTRLLTNGPQQVLDYVSYGNLATNYSYGSFPDGQSFLRQTFFFATPGATNNSAGAPLTVSINEWMAGNTHTLQDPQDKNNFDDWFELYNYSTNTVDLTGCYLTNALTSVLYPTSKVPAGYSIPPQGFLLVWADKKTPTGSGDLHTNFKLSKSGAKIVLYDPLGNLIDLVAFGIQAPDIAQGRYPDGSANIYTLPAPTPRTNNAPVNTAPVVLPLGSQYVYLGQTLSFTALATDSDTPSQVLTYSLDAGSPTNASINPVTGLFTWTPTLLQTPSTNTLTVRATDNGAPVLSGSQTFMVTVLNVPAFSYGLSGNTLSLAWPTAPGKVYRVQYKNDLSDPVWTAVGADQVGTGDLLTLNVDLTDQAQRFYSLLLVN